MVSNHVKGSVGAGNLVITLPDEDIPVLVKIMTPALQCESFQKPEEN